MKHIEDDATNATAAAHWAERLEDPSRLSVEERKRFGGWVMASADHLREWVDELALAEGLKLLRRQNEAQSAREARIRAMIEVLRDSERDSELVPRKRFGGTRARAFGWGALAATVIVGLVAVWWRLGRVPTSPVYTADATAQRVLTLEDGSVVQLRPGSTLTASLLPDKREAHLLSGSAFFTVHPDKTRPFRVEAGKATAVVTGTAFEVSLEGDATDFAVAEGQVQVAGHAAPGASVTLSQGDQTRVAEGHVGLVLHQFQRMTLAEIAGVYNKRGRPPKFVVRGTACSRRLSAALNVDDPLDLMRALDNDTDLVLTKEPETEPVPTTVFVRMRTDAASDGSGTQETCVNDSSQPVALNGALSQPARDCLHLQGAPLKEVVAEVNRYNRRQLAIIDPSIENERLGGTVCPADLDGFLSLIDAFGVRVVGRAWDGSDREVIRLAGVGWHPGA
jgi:transmembrane sensor